jgi:DNA-binding protein H-NS
MAKSYTQLMKQIDALSREAEALKRKEVDGVIARIKEAIEAYGLTAADLGLGARRGPAPAAGKRPARKAPARRPKRTVAPKSRDEAGNTWAGRGARPRWLRDALANGKTLQDFAI